VPIDPAPRRGRRDNGLDAAAYVPLADVDPRVGEHLLDLLKLAGVPAYLEPSADVEPYTRTLALPSPPTDRLWVDREQRATAREIVEAERAEAHAFPPRPEVGRGDDRPSHGLTDLDEERAWEEIVAAYNADVATTPVAPWPVPEDADDDPPPGPVPPRPRPPSLGPPSPVPSSQVPSSQVPSSPGPPSPVPPGAGPPGAPPSPEDIGPAPGDKAGEGRGDQVGRKAPDQARPPDPPVPAPADDEEHYHPPPPPPVPRPSRRTALGIFLVVLGALLLFGPKVLGVDASSGFTFGVLSILAGAAVLVLGLRDARSDDGPDDGAIV
jgi:hypothetical protein